MTFDEILEQIITLLKRQGRVSYRALKRRFDLSDEYIDDLKEEILYVHEPIVEADDRGFTWTGETQGTPPTTSQPVLSPERHPKQQVQPIQTEPAHVRPTTPDAERRQLTVMFCDLADSTRLSGQLDPEDLRDVIRAYQATSAEVIERYDGYIAQHLGDGLMVYFGWPQAHEDDAQRAVHAGLGILESMAQLNTRLEQKKGIRLAVRIGIHTGLVVVGEIGDGARHEHLALGETPNVASRIEGIAEPDTVAVSDTTYQLIQAYFVCEDLGQHTLRGVDDARQVYRVIRESDVQSRFEVAAVRRLTPLVGRETETILLFERWQQVKDGQGQVVLLSGEAGIGKSRLLQVLRDHIVGEPHVRLECRSSPYYQNTALYPITDILQRALQWQQDDTPEQRLAKLEQELSQYRLPLEDLVPLFAPLLSLPIPEDRYPPLNLSPPRQRQKTLESIVAILLEQAERQPVLFILEDVHWLDPTSLELLDLLLGQTPTTSILTLLTCRPTFQTPWSSHSYLTQMTLNRLSRNQIEDMAERVAGGKHLPAEVMQQIVEKTDGVPLYVEELTKAMLESETLQEVDGHYELAGALSSIAIPTTLQDSLMARLDRLVTAKGVAQYASVIGRQFSYALLQAVLQLDETMLQHELRRLVDAELLYQRGLPPQATYTFKHALIQDTAYESLLRSTRQQYHQRIAQVLEKQFSETTETQPELLAHHYTEAGRPAQALPYWQQAGQRANERSAYAEGEAHLTKGLEVLSTLHETPERAQHELTLCLSLGPALMATRGQHTEEVERVYTRARELCQQVGETPQLFTALGGLHRFYFVKGALPTVQELAEQFLEMAQRHDDLSLRLVGHWLLGTPLIWLGEVQSAHDHFEQSIALYNPEQHRGLALRYGLDPVSASVAYNALTLLALGYPEQARQRGQEALRLADKLAHPFSQTYVLLLVAILYCQRRDGQTASEYAEAALSLSTEHGFPIWVLVGTCMRGMVLAERGCLEEGVSELQQGMDAWRAEGIELLVPMFLAALAEAHLKAGQPEAGYRLLVDAMDTVNRTAQHFREAELYRLRGECLLAQFEANPSEAEACFQQALDVARHQQAKSLELRAAASLARLWQAQGKRQVAYKLLQPVYGWFTEGFDTADLKDARALLSELEG